tara:strand:+ start:332 stop:1276 length:945 start_codon:yes stop_codon:yes gene_type:complete
MKNFALIGASGYIAPRHMQAIKKTKNNLVAAYDPYDGIGIIDSYFPDAKFFVEMERFDRYIDKIRNQKTNKIDYISICSPNYLHDSHIRFSLKSGCDAICEKPLVLNPWNLERLMTIEQESKQNIYSILQLRLHPSIINLNKYVKAQIKSNNKKFDVDLTYITSRGNWYFTSWKGNEQKSGGICTNIGIHFFDMLGWIFGDLQNSYLHYKSSETMAGFIEFQNARVRWYLSVNKNNLPSLAIKSNKTTYRSIIVDKKEIEFSDGFTDLHTESYKKILNNQGFELSDTIASIKIVSDLRTMKVSSNSNEKHPFIQ